MSDVTHLIYIWMPDFGKKLETRRTVRIIWRELQAGLHNQEENKVSGNLEWIVGNICYLEITSFVKSRRRTKDSNFPLKEVVVVGQLDPESFDRLFFHGLELESQGSQCTISCHSCFTSGLGIDRPERCGENTGRCCSLLVWPKTSTVVGGLRGSFLNPDDKKCDTFLVYCVSHNHGPE